MEIQLFWLLLQQRYQPHVVKIIRPSYLYSYPFEIQLDSLLLLLIIIIIIIIVVVVVIVVIAIILIKKLLLQ